MLLTSGTRLGTALAFGVILLMSGCHAATPIQPVNRSPVVHSLLAFPTTIGSSDSAVVVCIATDADGDTVVFDWDSDCRLVMKGASRSGTAYNRPNVLVVYAGCVTGPVDTGSVYCFARDGRGGGAYAGRVSIIVHH